MSATRVHSTYEAIRLLTAQGISFDQVRMDTVEHIYRDRTTGARVREEQDGIFRYFMIRDEATGSFYDVAYYMPNVESLFIHEKPRLWGEYAMANSKDITSQFRLVPLLVNEPEYGS